MSASIVKRVVLYFVFCVMGAWLGLLFGFASAALWPNLFVMLAGNTFIGAPADITGIWSLTGFSLGWLSGAGCAFYVTGNRSSQEQ